MAPYRLTSFREAESMTVTVYLEGPTKASRRLSPLTARVLGPGWTSWHTAFAVVAQGSGRGSTLGQWT